MPTPNIRDQIEALLDATQQESRSGDETRCALNDLSDALDAESYSALALVTSTAAKGYPATSDESVDTRLAIIDLCQRLLEGIDTDGSFEFADIDPRLEALLFPSPIEETNVTDLSSDASESDLEAHNEEPTTSGSEQELIETCRCSDPSLLDEFLNEAQEHLDSAEQLVLTLEDNPADQEAIHGVFRAVHSLKGSSGILGLGALARLSHTAESVLVKVRDGALSLDGGIFAAVLLAMDYLNRQLASMRASQTPEGTVQCVVAPTSLIKVLDGICNHGRCDEGLLAQVRAMATKPQKEEQEVVAAKPRKAATQESLRVDGRRLEQLIDLIGELVITESAVSQELCKRESLAANSIATRLKKVVRDVQQLSLTLKMVPVGAILQKMNRMVRDVSEKLNKPCRFVIEGGDTEVDKTLLEGLADPLVHLIRNSLDHGIEPAVADRLAAGKPEVATVRVNAEHRSGNILITISDDGRGLNRERILSRAVEKGIVPSHAKLSDAEIDQLIFQPGFSTAATVSDISGRGVGMDVVRKNVEMLRGSITVNSRPGLGTDICLELPLTLSIIDGTVVKVGERSFIIPTLSVMEQVQVADLEVSTSGGHSLARYRDKFIPVNQLSDLLSTPRGVIPKHGQVCLVVQASQKYRALLVDRVLGQQPVVIKPLGGVLEAFDCFAGGALLANGEIGFVLDLNVICGATSRPSPNEINARQSH